MPRPPRMHALQQTRRHGIGRLLLMARRDFLARLAPKMAGRIDAALLHSSSTLLPFIDVDGTRSTELARRMGISKQAVGQRVRELENAGFLRRSVDAADGRAFLVGFTPVGVAFLREMHAAIERIEREYDTLAGAEDMAAVRRALALIAYGADDGAP